MITLATAKDLEQVLAVLPPGTFPSRETALESCRYYELMRSAWVLKLSCGTVLGGAGVNDLGRRYGTAWAAFSPLCLALYWRTVHKFVVGNLNHLLAERFDCISAAVMEDHAAGHCWAVRLGFRPIRRIAELGPEKEPAVVYERRR